MYLAHKVGGWSTTRIGRFYNGRDHSTVCYGIHRIAALRESRVEVDELLTTLVEEITNAHEGDRRSAPVRSPMGSPLSLGWLLEDELLDVLADRVAVKIAGKLVRRKGAA